MLIVLKPWGLLCRLAKPGMFRWNCLILLRLSTDAAVVCLYPEPLAQPYG